MDSVKVTIVADRIEQHFQNHDVISVLIYFPIHLVSISLYVLYKSQIFYQAKRAKDGLW